MELGIVIQGVVALIGMVIVLSIGTNILGSVGFDCTGLSGNWSTTCGSVQTEGQAAYKLLLILPMILAASLLLLGVRFFGGF